MIDSDYTPTYLDAAAFRPKYVKTIEQVRFKGYTNAGGASRIDWPHMARYLERLFRVLRAWYPRGVRPVDVYVYEDDTPKRLPPRGEALTPDHVNSGYSARSDEREWIVLFRLQEIHKVLCHELIHVYDRVHTPTPAQRAAIVRAFHFPGIEASLSVNEAIVELNATCAHAMVHALSATPEGEDPSKVYRRAMRREYEHTMRLIATLRDHFGIAPTADSWARWREHTTHAFSYIVLKGVYMARAFGWDASAFKHAKQKNRRGAFTMTITRV